jgi:hypothetical protein
MFMLVTVAVACRSRSQEPWQEYSSPRGGFSVKVPTTPTTTIDASTHRKEDVQPDGSLRDGAPFVAEQTRSERGEDGLYTVRWYEVPVSNEMSDRDFLERLLATKKLGPVIPRWIHLGEFPGFEYERLDPETGVLLRSRLFIVQGRVFHLWSDNWLERDDEVAARRFLDSFHLAVAPGLKVTYDGVVADRR